MPCSTVKPVLLFVLAGLAVVAYADPSYAQVYYHPAYQDTCMAVGYPTATVYYYAASAPGYEAFCPQPQYTYYSYVPANAYRIEPPHSAGQPSPQPQSPSPDGNKKPTYYAPTSNFSQSEYTLIDTRQGPIVITKDFKSSWILRDGSRWELLKRDK